MRNPRVTSSRWIYWRTIALAPSVMLATSISASEKVFLSAVNTCYLAGGQVYATVNKELFYSEIIGSLNGINAQYCAKSFFDTRQCRNVTLYNLLVTCRGGLATAPQLYMALFGNDQTTRQNGFILNNNQLSYIDPVRDFSGQNGRRVSFPPGYAPLNTAPIDTIARRLSWDDGNQRPLLARSISNDQERRIREMFVTNAGHVEPFPESNIRRAAEISEEKPSPPPPPPPPPVSVSSPFPAIPTVKSGFNIETNSNLALGAGLIFVAFVSWVFGTASKFMSGERPHFWRQVAVESLSLIISGTVLYSFGIVDEIKLLSIPLVGGLSIALVSTVRYA